MGPLNATTICIRRQT